MDNTWLAVASRWSGKILDERFDLFQRGTKRSADRVYNIYRIPNSFFILPTLIA